ncbi:MAG: LamG domain-containing protein [Planctomycetia bacterium]|nr:LamG domain-containing protein [Planctomycetia bacterium]
MVGLFAVCYATFATAQEPAPAVDWQFTNLEMVGEHKMTIIGSPRLIDTPNGKAAEFDGQSGLFLEINPLAGLKQFTAEVVFQPYAAGAKEQRFLHFQEDGSENRLLFEIRLTGDNRWFLDTFIKSGDGNYTLFAEKSPHALGSPYHAAVVMDGTTMRHYVNGLEEMATPIKFAPQKDGRTSIGVRINRVSWFNGAVRRVRITPRVLEPQQFLPH